MTFIVCSAKIINLGNLYFDSRCIFWQKGPVLENLKIRKKVKCMLKVKIFRIWQLTITFMASSPAPIIRFNVKLRFAIFISNIFCKNITCCIDYVSDFISEIVYFYIITFNVYFLSSLLLLEIKNPLYCIEKGV